MEKKMTFCEWIKNLNSQQYSWWWTSSNGITHNLHNAESQTTICNMKISNLGKTGHFSYSEVKLKEEKVCKNCERIMSRPEFCDHPPEFYKEGSSGAYCELCGTDLL